MAALHVAKYIISAILSNMEDTRVAIAEQIQTITAKLLATQPVGYRLFLIGGFRYRLLDASCRSSIDLDYHWEGNLDSKQEEIVEVLRRRLLPEVQQRIGYEGTIRRASGPDADSPAVRIVEMAFYRPAVSGSRIEIPLEITHIPRLDPPQVRTAAGVVFLTVSDADMIESKVLALLNRVFTQARDILDIFLFQDRLPLDARERLSQKFTDLGLSPEDVTTRLGKLQAARAVHVRELERILDTQVASPVAANLRLAGGGTVIWDQVLARLMDLLVIQEQQP